MQYWFDKIWHYLTSNSRHGTHSPFVYRLADKAIYNRDSKSLINEGDKSSRLIYEIIMFLESEGNQSVKVQVLSLDDIRLTKGGILDTLKTCPVLFLKNIYLDRSTKRKWSDITGHPKVTVSLDLFYFGILIVRKEQPKQYFKLRFPYLKY